MSGDAADTQGLSTRDQWRLITRLQEQNALLEQEVAALRAQKARWLQGSGSGGAAADSAAAPGHCAQEALDPPGVCSLPHRTFRPSLHPRPQQP